MMAMRVTAREVTSPRHNAPAHHRAAARRPPADDVRGRPSATPYARPSMDDAVRPKRQLLARPSRAGAAALFIGAGIVAALATVWFQRICATRVSLDDAGAFDALLAVAGGVGVLGL